jgi:hypothetical protein
MRLTQLASATLAAAVLLSSGAVLAADAPATESQALGAAREGNNGPRVLSQMPEGGPAPVGADGRALLQGLTPQDKGLWTPVFGILDPISPADTVPFQPWSRALYAARQLHELEPHARCKASGAARQFLTPYGVEFVEMKELERMYIFDVGGPHTFRTVYMDGREHPADFEPTNYGHSVGHWEGSTLVVDTVGYNEDFWLDRRGLPHTEQMHTIERFTRINENAIDYKIVVDDPGAYTANWEGGFYLRWNAGQELFEYSCQQANYAHELMVGQESSSVDRSSTIVP